jgi:hypothetical protein
MTGAPLTLSLMTILLIVTAFLASKFTEATCPTKGTTSSRTGFAIDCLWWQALQRVQPSSPAYQEALQRARHLIDNSDVDGDDNGSSGGSGVDWDMNANMKHSRQELTEQTAQLRAFMKALTDACQTLGDDGGGRGVCRWLALSVPNLAQTGVYLRHCELVPGLQASPRLARRLLMFRGHARLLELTMVQAPLAGVLPLSDLWEQHSQLPELMEHVRFHRRLLASSVLGFSPAWRRLFARPLQLGQGSQAYGGFYCKRLLTAAPGTLHSWLRTLPLDINLAECLQPLVGMEESTRPQQKSHHPLSLQSFFDYGGPGGRNGATAWRETMIAMQLYGQGVATDGLLSLNVKIWRNPSCPLIIRHHDALIPKDKAKVKKAGEKGPTEEERRNFVINGALARWRFVAGAWQPKARRGILNPAVLQQLALKLDLLAYLAVLHDLLLVNSSSVDGNDDECREYGYDNDKAECACDRERDRVFDVDPLRNELEMAITQGLRAIHGELQSRREQVLASAGDWRMLADRDGLLMCSMDVDFDTSRLVTDGELMAALLGTLRCSPTFPYAQDGSFSVQGVIVHSRHHPPSQ